MEKFRNHLENAGPVNDDFKDTAYLDFAEIIVKNLLNMGIQQENGFICDPFDAKGITYSGKKLELFYYHAEARFCGALGHLIKAGRLKDFADSLYLSYSHLLNLLAFDFEPDYFAEFWVKELVFAYEGLKSIGYPGFDRDIWEKVTWRKYGFHYFNSYNNAIAYALASEACMLDSCLGGDADFFDAWAPVLFDGFNEKYGMYVDPGSPMAYDMITKQQMLYAIKKGADGELKPKALELCNRGAVSSLYMQSVTGQMPFGGRTNQFLCVDAILADFFELMACIKTQERNKKEAGIYKRAAHNASLSIEPWLKMKPFRHIRQGFEPELGHGIDSGGVYTVYGLLTASMLGTAYFDACDSISINSIETPADRGGYVFATDSDFHKVFASCGGYHIEIDTNADPEKDCTGLGRLHKKGIMPETALSGSCAPDPTYSYALPGIEPSACAIGPAWTDSNGYDASLAEYGRKKLNCKINIMSENREGVAFSICYDIDGILLEETFQLSKDGLLYGIKGDMEDLHITVPLISTDGECKSRISLTEEGLILEYRDSGYKVICEQPELTGDSCVNRNGIYEIARIRDHMIKLQLIGCKASQT